MASVFDVAAYVLELVGSVTTMKLQKLVYYSQVRYLVVHDQPLFDERIEAWANGPVVYSLFKKHSGKYMVDHSLTKRFGPLSELTQEQKKAVELVVDRLGKESGEQLRERTHREDPWKNARKGYSAGESCTEEITVDSIREYYLHSDCDNPILSR